MTSKRYRWIQESPSSFMVGRQPKNYGMRTELARSRANHPLTRWRMAVGAVFEPLILVIIPLILWGIVSTAAVPLTLGIGLAASLVLLTGGTLVVSLFAYDAGVWQPGEAR